MLTLNLYLLRLLFRYHREAFKRNDYMLILQPYQNLEQLVKVSSPLINNTIINLEEDNNFNLNSYRFKNIATEQSNLNSFYHKTQTLIFKEYQQNLNLLPARLNSLELKLIRKPEDNEVLPPKLKQLNLLVDNSKIGNGLEYLQSLTSLTSLTIYLTYSCQLDLKFLTSLTYLQATNQSIISYPPSLKIFKTGEVIQTFQNLPPTLEVLEITNCEINIQDLPSSLKILKIKQWFAPYNQCRGAVKIINLPSTLKELTLDSFWYFPVIALPASLTSLSIINGQILPLLANGSYNLNYYCPHLQNLLIDIPGALPLIFYPNSLEHLSITAGRILNNLTLPDKLKSFKLHSIPTSDDSSFRSLKLEYPSSLLYLSLSYWNLDPLPSNLIYFHFDEVSSADYRSKLPSSLKVLKVMDSVIN